MSTTLSRSPRVLIGGLIVIAVILYAYLFCAYF